MNSKENIKYRKILRISGTNCKILPNVDEYINISAVKGLKWIESIKRKQWHNHDESWRCISTNQDKSTFLNITNMFFLFVTNSNNAYRKMGRKCAKLELFLYTVYQVGLVIIGRLFWGSVFSGSFVLINIKRSTVPHNKLDIVSFTLSAVDLHTSLRSLKMAQQ